MNIFNERIKLAATALNNVAVGSIISGVVVPLTRGDIPFLASAIVWIIIGLDFAFLAQLLLGRLDPI